MQAISKLRNICNKAYYSSIALRTSFVSTPISASKRIPISLLSVAKSNTKTALASYSRDYYITVFLYMALCNLVEFIRHFGQSYYFQL
jgi:hypothetical protein